LSLRIFPALPAEAGIKNIQRIQTDYSTVTVSSDDKTARIWDAATGTEIKVLRGHENDVNSAAFSPNGTRVLTASWDETAPILDTATWNEIRVLRGHEYAVTSAAFSPDGTRIVTASDDNTARIWDAHFATMSTNGLLVETVLVGLPVSPS
jgi:WD40 repeat protein